jgi:hypothetical protein
VIEVSLIGSPPEVKVTTGILIGSLAVIERVTTSPTLASVSVELLEEILTLDSEGAVTSSTGTITILSIRISPLMTAAPVFFLNLNPRSSTVPVHVATELISIWYVLKSESLVERPSSEL